MLKPALAFAALFISATGGLAADFEQSQIFDWTGPYVGIQGDTHLVIQTLLSTR